MIPTCIRLSGFMSYRDPQELCFDSDGLWVLEGNNGVGKSTIFDAITFVLFGQHRLGKQNHGDLINHACDSLEVDLTLQLENGTYKLSRCVPRKGRATWAISRRQANGTFLPETGTEQKAGYDAWVADQLGLDYDAFTTSVLLLQGESEKLIKADPRDRRKLLAKLIDLSRYEELHARAKEKEDDHRREVEHLGRQLQSLRDLGAEDVVLAATALTAATEDRERLNGVVEELSGLLKPAEERERLLVEEVQWTGLRVKQQEILSRAAEIRAGMGELVVLEPVLRPLREAAAVLAGLVQAESDAADREQKVTALRVLEEAAEQAEQAARLREEEVQQREEKSRHKEEDLRAERETLHPLLERWKLAEALREELSGRAAQIAALPAPAEEATQHALGAAREALHARQGEKARAGAEQELLLERLRRFDELTGQMSGESVPCGLCGQAVTAAHAQEERERLGIEQERQGTVLLAAAACQNDAAGAVKRAEQVYAEASNEGQRRRALLEIQTDGNRSLSRILEGLTEESAQAAARRLAELQPALGGLQEERAAQQKALRATRGEKTGAATRLRQAQTERKRLEQDLDQVRGQRQQALGQLVALRGLLPQHLCEARPEQVAETAARVLLLAPYREQAQRLQEAETDEAGRRLQEILRQLDGIPVAARRPAEELKRALGEQREAKQAAEKLRDQRATELSGVRLECQQRVELSAGHEVALKERRLYGLLADRLGPEELQRRLVRDAEQAIVQLANQELRGLTQGRICVALRPGKENKESKDSDDGAQKALDLLVYNQETGEQPTALLLASGSQKFRIAISLALAIGRYLARETRRVESVIIDEGFGCLDRASREDAVTVLKELSGHLSRVILVSHQEEFYGRFHNGYRIDLVDRTSVPTRVER